MLADELKGQEWQGEPALALVRQLDEQNPGVLFVCAGATQSWVIGQAVADLHLDRRRLMGSAPMAWRAAAQALVALHTDRSPADVTLDVAGSTRDLFALWSSATIGGRSVHEVFTRPEQLSIDARFTRLWPPGAYALATAAARFCEAAVRGSYRTLTGFVCLRDELGTAARGSMAALPMRIGTAGIEEVLVPTLSAQERTRLETAVWS